MKKCIAFLTTALLIIQTFVFTVAPVSAASVRYTEGEAIFGQLGFVVNNPEEPKGEFDTVSRGEFVQILMNIMNQPASTATFDDLDETHDYYGALSTASRLGIITGTEVRPDKAIRYNEIVTMLVRALGYEDYAVAKGGYPIGYLDMARRTDITKGISIQGDMDATYGDTISLLYNAVEAEVLKVVAFSEAAIRYEVADNETLLSAYHNLYKKDGLVKGTRDISMVSASIPEGFIRIDGSNYDIAVENPDAYVGMYVEFYYNPDENLIRAMTPVDNSVLTLSADTVIGFDMDDQEFEYNDENMESLYGELSPSAIVMYNNVPAISFTEDLFVGKDGTFVFIDNNDDKKYDVVFLNLYEDFVVSSVDPYNGVAYNLYDSSTITLKDTETVQTSFKNELGRVAYPEELVKGDVITVMRSQDSSRVTAILSNTEIYGTIDQVINEEGTCTITIDGTVYAALPAFIEHEEPEVGESASFRMNVNGRISAINRSGASSRQYAYLIAGKPFGNALNRTYQVKLFSQDGKVAAYQLANRLTLDGDFLPVEEAYSRLADVEGNVTPCIIRFGANKNGLVNWIDTTSQGINENAGVTRIYSSFYDAEGAERETPEMLNWGQNMGCFSATFPLTDADTKVFCLPADVVGAEDDEFEIKTPNEAFMNSTTYAIEMFDIDTDSVVDVVVYALGAGESGGGALLDNFAVVTGITKMADKDENEIIKLTMLSNGIEMEFIVEDPALLTNIVWITAREAIMGTEIVMDGTGIVHELTVGDAIRYNVVSGTNIISRIAMLQNVVTNQFAYEVGNQSSKTFNYMVNFCKGEVYSVIDGRYFRWFMGESVPENVTLEQMETHVINKYKIYVIDRDKPAKERVRVGGASDLTGSRLTGDGTNFIISTRYGQSGSLAIYR